jgi:hypothetical protein
MAAKKKKKIDKSEPLLTFTKRPIVGDQYRVRTAIPYDGNIGKATIEVKEIRNGRLKYADVDSGELKWIAYDVWYSRQHEK